MSKKRKRAPDSSGNTTSATSNLASSAADSTSSEPAFALPAKAVEETGNAVQSTQAKPELISEHLVAQKATSTTRALPSPKWLYIHLQPIVPRVVSTLNATYLTAKSSFKLDETTLRLHLLSALSAYLGDTGAAVLVDILKLSDPGDVDTTMESPVTIARSAISQVTTGSNKQALPEAYLRVPYGDGALFCAAVTSWAGTNSTGGSGLGGYRILEKSCWLSCLTLHDHAQENDLFDFSAG